MTKKKMALGLFVYPTGHHIAGWRHPLASWRGMEGFAPYRDVVLAAERAKFHMAFFADALGVIGPSGSTSAAYGSPVAQLDPLTLISSLAPLTSNIGLIATVSTSYNEPYNVARKFASLDIITGGRTGWNLVTSSSPVEATHFSMAELPSPEARYARATEFADIVFDLWESVQPGAFRYDAETGLVIDYEKLRIREHQGVYFQVRGPLDVTKSPQGRPIVVQAGSSAPGIALASKVADVTFSAAPTKEIANAYYVKLKSALSAAGRSPESCRVMPGLMPIVGTSRQHAEDIKGGYLEAVNDEIARGMLRMLRPNYEEVLDVDLSLPPPDSLFEGSISRVELLKEKARAENMTVRDLGKHLSMARGHNIVTGTGQDVADVMEDWFTSQCADGFNIMPASFMNGLNAFNAHVIPELQRRGLFRTDYEGDTLRSDLGLPPL